jgi:hypothetical protein
VHRINAELPLHSMWDGFWVHSFKRGTLVISCSFDRIYYRDFDLVFKKVIFFNLPPEWRDTDVPGDELLRIASREEFHKFHPHFDTQERIIFAIDLHFKNSDSFKKQTFFILAEHVFLNKCEAPDNNPVPEYHDPFEAEDFPVFKNRVIR